MASHARLMESWAVTALRNDAPEDVHDDQVRRLTEYKGWCRCVCDRACATFADLS